MTPDRSTSLLGFRIDVLHFLFRPNETSFLSKCIDQFPGLRGILDDRKRDIAVVLTIYKRAYRLPKKRIGFPDVELMLGLGPLD